MSGLETHPLRPLMRPRSIAVIGASARGNRGSWMLRNLARFGFPGKVWAVNPNYAEIEGVPCFPALDALPEPAELVAIALPAAPAVEAVRQAAALGARAGLIIGGGFGEGAGKGRELQDELAAICRASGMKLCGPNCYGIFDVHYGSAPFAGDIVDPLVPGRVGFVIQSGAVSHAVHDTAIGRGLGLSHIVTSGNEAVVELAEYVDWMVEDPGTAVIAVFIEGLKKPDRFAAVAAKALAAGKPIIALKVGRSERGRKATLAHTGSVAGADAAYDGLFRKLGVVRVDDLDEMREATILFSAPRRPRGSGFALASISGGLTTMLTDMAEEHGLGTPQPAAETRARIARVLPEFGVANNPLDTTGVLAEKPEILAGVVEGFLADPGIDCFALALNTPLGTVGHRKRARILAETQARIDKPLVCFSVSSAGADREVIETLAGAGVPFLLGARESVVSMRRWAWYEERRCAMAGDRGRLANGFGHVCDLPCDGRRVVAENAARVLLAPYAIPFVAQRRAGDARAAVLAAEELGWPVALKIDSPDIAHKTECGGVRLGLRDAAEFEQAHTAMLAEVRRHAPRAAIDGVLVQRMAPKGVEALIGVKRDPDFGLLLVAGVGGTLVELLREVSLRPIPITAADAEEMLAETRLAALLAGFRGAVPADRAALVEVMLALSDAACDLGERLAEIDLNPAIVLPRGVTIVDALVVLRDDRA